MHGLCDSEVIAHAGPGAKPETIVSGTYYAAMSHGNDSCSLAMRTLCCGLSILLSSMKPHRSQNNAVQVGSYQLPGTLFTYSLRIVTPYIVGITHKTVGKESPR